MRLEFDPNLNGAWDKLHRYHHEAATDTALRQGTTPREPIVKTRLSAWTRRVLQLLHLRSSPTH